jgi:hemolysin III
VTSQRLLHALAEWRILHRPPADQAADRLPTALFVAHQTWEIAGMYKGERFNSITHLVGAALAVAGSVVLLTYAAIDGEFKRIVSYSVYAATLVLLYLVSTLYHSLPGTAKRVFRILDHQAIYLLIAGTYTPFIVMALDGPQGWWMFGAIWGLAILGTVLDALPRKGVRVVPVVIYLVMGWLCVFTLDPIIAALPPAGFHWLVAGGVFYTSGIVFYVLDQWFPWSHGVWHLFVLAGSISHFVAIFLLY